MTRKNDTSPAAARGVPGRAWTAPRMRRLVTSEASLSAAGGNDGEGLS
jgi:hypothetical protein